MRADSKEVILALRYLLQYDLSIFKNNNKNKEEISAIYQAHDSFDLPEGSDERAELREIADSIGNLIILAIGIGDLFEIFANEDGTFSIRLFNKRLKYFESIKHKVVADLILTEIYVRQGWKDPDKAPFSEDDESSEGGMLI